MFDFSPIFHYNTAMKLDIVDMGINGEGVSRHDGKVCFVPFALTGETVTAHITRENKDFAQCQVDEILTHSAGRVVPRCPYFAVCGGCTIQHLDYARSLDFKRKLVQNTIKKIAKIDLPVSATVPSVPYGYRNKSVFPIAHRDGHNVIGMFTKGTHTVVPVTRCAIADDRINAILAIVRDFVSTTELKGYDFASRKGDLRYAVIRSVGDRASVIIVATRRVDLGALVDMLPTGTSVHLNINTDDKHILSQHFVHISGESKLQSVQNGIQYYISPYSFAQINDGVRSALYDEIVRHIRTPIVIDAYSGAGLLSAIMSRHCRQVYGIEIARSATADADDLMRNNGFANVININGDCAEVLPKCIADMTDEYTIVLDPPRAGVDAGLIARVNVSSARYIIYVSCHPSTLARDIARLDNFSVVSVQPFDMFPQTADVETLVILTRKK